MNDTEPLDLDAMTQRALAAERVLEYGPYERVDWVARYSTDVPALIAEVRRLREETESQLNPRVVLASIDYMLEPMTTHRGTHLSILKLYLRDLRNQVAQYVPPKEVPQ